MINNYNPAMMTCIRSNHDIKFILSGKDGKNIAFYVTNYATKSQLSSHNMVPLIALSKERLDQDTTIVSSDVNARAKAMITKCLNRITTETEISAAHVSHFLLGNSDSKTSHKFTKLNLHSALAWLANEIKMYEDSIDVDNENENEDSNSVNPDVSNDENDDSDDSEDDEDDEDESTSYTISTGNEGYVLVNEMTDYINRGESLEHMCFYEYRSKVYKAKFTDEDVKKHEKTKETSRRCEQRHRFSASHPQSETHWQKVRLHGMVPTLSIFPPTKNSNNDKYQKCILLLFKPFTTFQDLYNGDSWDETYIEFLDTTERVNNIENIEEVHIGIDMKKENDEEDNVDLVEDIVDDDEFDDDTNQMNETDTGTDSQTTEALDVIKNTPWLDESVTNHKIRQNIQPVLGTSSRLPLVEMWTGDMDRQNQDILNNVEPDEVEIPNPLLSQTEFTTTTNNDVELSYEPCNDSTQDGQDFFIGNIVDSTIRKYNLNKKQTVAFKSAIENVIKRYKGEKTEQFIGYVGGPGGTGKSQVIKAIVDFHKKLKVKHTLKLCAHTGTAAKHIGGSTTTTLFGFDSNKKRTKLQSTFEKVDTIIVDEVSMIGCRQLAKISNALTKAKCASPSLPFGGVDMIFFGDFIQFPPVKDSPLYSAWKTGKNTAKKKQSEINKELGRHLWKQVNHIILLDEQMRVQDQAYLGMLNRLREGNCLDSDVEMLNTRVVGHTVDITSIVDAPIIAPGNQLVMAVNDLFVASHSQHTRVSVSIGQDYIGKRKKKVPKNVAKKYRNWASTRTKGLPRELQLFVGMPVIVTTNIKTELGITNGTMGVVRLIHFKNGQVINEDTGVHYLEENPDYIIVELDDISVKPLDGLPPNHIPIVPIKKSFSVYMPGKTKAVNVNRIHFPLVPRYSCTAHKSQGKTLSKAIVDLVPLKRGVGIEFAYVPLSRVRRLADLTILRPFNPSILRAKVNEGCAAMMEEFRRRDLCRDI